MPAHYRDWIRVFSHVLACFSLCLHYFPHVNLSCQPMSCKTRNCFCHVSFQHFLQLACDFSVLKRSKVLICHLGLEPPGPTCVRTFSCLVTLKSDLSDVRTAAGNCFQSPATWSQTAWVRSSCSEGRHSFFAQCSFWHPVCVLARSWYVLSASPLTDRTLGVCGLPYGAHTISSQTSVCVHDHDSLKAACTMDMGREYLKTY